jgi:hypothetical protein
MADTVTDALRTARDNYATQLVDLSDPDKRKVSYSVDGRSMSWTEYQRFLLDAIKTLDGAIAEREASAIGGGTGYVATSAYQQRRGHL